MYYVKETGKYRAQIKVDGKKKHLGCHANPDDAYRAELIAKIDRQEAMIEKEQQRLLKMKKELSSGAKATCRVMGCDAPIYDMGDCLVHYKQSRAVENICNGSERHFQIK